MRPDMITETEVEISTEECFEEGEEEEEEEEDMVTLLEEPEPEPRKRRGRQEFVVCANTELYYIKWGNWSPSSLKLCESMHKQFDVVYPPPAAYCGALEKGQTVECFWNGKHLAALWLTSQARPQTSNHRLEVTLLITDVDFVQEHRLVVDSYWWVTNSTSQVGDLHQWFSDWSKSLSPVWNVSFLIAGRKPKTHQSVISNSSLDLGIKKKPREGKGTEQ